jgi:hypothetical protein
MMNVGMPQMAGAPHGEAVGGSLTRDQIVRQTVIDVRSTDPKSKLRSDQCRSLRQSAERLADRLAGLDEVTQRIVIGLCTQRRMVADGAMLDGFVDEARMVSEALHAQHAPWRDTYGRDLGQRPERMLWIMKELVVRSRCQMDPKTRMAPSGCKGLRDRAEALAQSILDLDDETQEVVMGFCVRGGMADGSQLQGYIDQAKLLITALHEPFPPPLPPPQR